MNPTWEWDTPYLVVTNDWLNQKYNYIYCERPLAIKSRKTQVRTYLFKTEPMVTLFGSELSLDFPSLDDVPGNGLLVPEYVLSNPFLSSVSVSLSNEDVGFFFRCFFIFFFYGKIIIGWGSNHYKKHLTTMFSNQFQLTLSFFFETFFVVSIALWSMFFDDPSISISVLPTSSVLSLISVFFLSSFVVSDILLCFPLDCELCIQ